MKIDIERLNKNICKLDKNESFKINEGKTFTLLQLLLGYIFVGPENTTVVYISDYYIHAFNSFMRLLSINDVIDYNITKKQYEFNIQKNNQRIIFLSSCSSLIEKIRGITLHGLYIDINHAMDETLLNNIRTRIK